jgi:hypothetical protein
MGKKHIDGQQLIDILDVLVAELKKQKIEADWQRGYRDGEVAAYIYIRSLVACSLPPMNKKRKAEK